MANTTSPVAAEGLGFTGNLTLAESISQWPAAIWNNRDFLLLEARIVGSAMACIYVSSQAALRRPPSARLPKKKKGKHGKKSDESSEDEYVQGLLLSDAIMFPILAGMVLVGLYYLIKWLEDPAILNKILGIYFSVMSLASMGKLFSDGLQLIFSMVFPEVWRAYDGSIFHFDNHKRSQYRTSESGEHIYEAEIQSPLPGNYLSKMKQTSLSASLWVFRLIVQEQWKVNFTFLPFVEESFHVKFLDILGVVLAVIANIIYHTTKSVMLSNIMGYAFSYAGIIMMSPTTFTTGSCVLFGLFFYDIYMVFYTPYMVTVATKLDVPIKLVFEGPQKASMLGLGDIVVPGMFVGLCLRFDHFLYYHRQKKQVPIDLKTTDENSGQVVTSTQTQPMVVRPDYVNPKSQWGNWFWTTGLGRFFWQNTNAATPALKAANFPKTYFLAAMIGYLLGMMVTLMMLLVFKHAQPALLYLVPGVVFAVWITGLFRGELHEMWIYTEDGSLDKEDVVVEVDGDGNVIEKADDTHEKKEDDTKALKKASIDKTAEKEEATAAEGEEPAATTVFAFTIQAPASLSRRRPRSAKQHTE
ncbi:Signal peptide peptidase 1 [Apiospora rasikravindrae]|uniref:Signal peptide peptidase 1 n=1 Tax=Apiospora rasikravindrae TaxID=990691 RepID=A0ABR1RMG9_9PEZI